MTEPSEIRIEDKEDEIGHKPDELGPRDRARLRLASQVLLAVVVMIGVALGAVLFCPPDRLEEAREFLSFVKTVAPPLITLVLGFYFNAQGDSA